MRTCVLLLFMLAAMQVIAGPAWRWVDANGTVHYSDRPVPGAQEVNLPGTARTPQSARASGSTAASGTVAAAAAQSSEAAGETVAYTRLAITSPESEETLWNLGGELTVSVSVSPALQRGHGIIVFYDGQPVNTTPATGSSYTVTDVFRGSHSVHAEIVDADKLTLMRSAPVQFYVQQTSIQNPNRG